MTNTDYSRLYDLWNAGNKNEVIAELLRMPASDVAEFVLDLARDNEDWFEAKGLIRRLRAQELPKVQQGL